MMHPTIATMAFALAAVPTLIHASALPFAAGDARRGATLVREKCQACHVRQFGDADRVYLRRDHHVTTAQQLMTQVIRCNTQASAGLFPEEEQDVAAYLNQRYYHFKP